jgi:two-component system, OmpR family, response regulator
MAEEAPGGDRPLRVLVVDDNKDGADSLCLLLGLWGYDARTAYDGAEALQAASAFLPDCLFLDVGLPGIDGYHLAQRIRQEPALSGAKLVALSAYSGPEHSRRVCEAGFDYDFTKPADPEAVRGLLKMLDQVMRLATRTQALAERNAELARETKDLIGEAKEDLKGVREEIREVRDEIREVKEEIREALNGDPGARPEEGA